MDEEILNSIAHQINEVSIERLGYEISSHKDLVATARELSEFLISTSPEAELALKSEGSDLLKAVLICRCIAYVFEKEVDHSAFNIRIAACASTSSRYFLEKAKEELSSETDNVKKSANLLLVSIGNELFGAANKSVEP